MNPNANPPRAFDPKDLAIDLALQCGDLGDGPDHPAFEREYMDPYHAVQMAFSGHGEAIFESFTPKVLDDLERATHELQAAIDGGSVEYRELAARTLAGLWLAHCKAAGRDYLQHFQNAAWEAAQDHARDVFLEGKASRGEVW